MKKDIELSDFFELTPDLVCLAGRDGFLKKVNSTVIRKLGYSEAELLVKPVTAFMHPDDIEMTVQNRFKLFQGEVLQNFCNRYITKNGEILWLEWTSVYIASSELVLAIAKDITSRKRIEQEVESQFKKYRDLASHFKKLVENDRRYFAYELHEKLAQLVAVVNLDLNWLTMHATDLPAKFSTRLEHTSAVCKLMIETIQRLAFSISPRMLDDFGLNATMDWLCHEFSVLHGIECSFIHDYNENSLTHEMKLDFFRITQETLADILNHPQADKIEISIKESYHGIELLIHDSGNGFAAEFVKQSKGLASIRERARSINGKISLQSRHVDAVAISLFVAKELSQAIS